MTSKSVIKQLDHSVCFKANMITGCLLTIIKAILAFMKGILVTSTKQTQLILLFMEVDK